jgi:hypothetical protein
MLIDTQIISYSKQSLLVSPNPLFESPLKPALECVIKNITAAITQRDRN